ncbi:MAG: hypothetical protein WC661_05095 [Opitutaceae bacterium]|jgi:hypothetical protein
MIDCTWFHIGEDPQLFVDDILIEVAQGITRRWHKPARHTDEPRIRRDRPWEQSPYFTYSNHVVIRDPMDGLIKCWYEDMGEVDGSGHPWKTRLLYAESRDGITFTKPELDICRWEGRGTNIVMGYQEGVAPGGPNPWEGKGVHSNGIVIDPFPATPAERFKTLFTEITLESGRPRHRIVCAHSPDGLHWTPYPWVPSIGSSGGNLSDVSCLHYDHGARMFVQNTRHGLMYQAAIPPGTPCVSNWFGVHYPARPDLQGKRRVFQTRSHDFQRWTEPLAVSTPDDALGDAVACDNLDVGHYGMQQFRVGRRHFATLGIFRYVDNEMEVRLLSSRDGLNFIPTDRAAAFLAPRGPKYWDAHMVSMTSQPMEVGNEWFFYHGGSRVHHDWWMSPQDHIEEPETRDPKASLRDGFGLGLARLRKEGLASLDGCRQRPGYLLTKPFHADGNQLVINARCRPGGFVQVAVLGANRQPLPGREREQSDPFEGDSTDHVVTWSGDAVMGNPGEWRQLLFYIRDAEIFSFRCPAGPANNKDAS